MSAWVRNIRFALTSHSWPRPWARWRWSKLSIRCPWSCRTGGAAVWETCRWWSERHSRLNAIVKEEQNVVHAYHHGSVEFSPLSILPSNGGRGHCIKNQTAILRPVPQFLVYRLIRRMSFIYPGDFELACGGFRGNVHLTHHGDVHPVKNRRSSIWNVTHDHLQYFAPEFKYRTCKIIICVASQGIITPTS